jgi:Mn-dependent DtxR family transcriptional regulator
VSTPLQDAAHTVTTTGRATVKTLVDALGVNPVEASELLDQLRVRGVVSYAMGAAYERTVLIDSPDRLPVELRGGAL